MVIYPVMVFELASSLMIFFLATKSDAFIYFALALLILIILWIYTFMYLNKFLKNIENDQSENQTVYIRQLIKANWVRTAGWSLRLLLLIAVILSSGQNS
jgi:fatty acid desaturase